MTIDFRTFISGSGIDYEARVESELEKRRVIHSQELIKVRIIHSGLIERNILRSNEAFTGGYQGPNYLNDNREGAHLVHIHLREA
jgi:hypothetical protein